MYFNIVKNCFKIIVIIIMIVDKINFIIIIAN